MICLCGAAEGQPHDNLCPYPEYNGHAVHEAAWRALREAAQDGNLADLRAMLTDTAQDIAQAVDNPLGWARLVVELVQALDDLAARREGDRALFVEGLRRLVCVDVIDRLLGPPGSP